MSVQSIFLTLRRPTRIFISSDPIQDAPLAVDGITTMRPGPPPWPALADILYDLNSRMLVGLTYCVSKQDRGVVQDFYSTLSGECINYNDLRSDESRQLYQEFDCEAHWLEIRWTKHPANKIEVAQLDSGYWYYTGHYYDQAVVFGLEDVEEILNTYELRLPDYFPFPSFVLGA